jgi:hypothetical protein
MAKKAKPTKKQPIVRAYRIGDETHLKLKELAKADDRKIGSKLTEIINKAHSAFFPPQGA